MTRPHISKTLRMQIAEDAGTLCGYCLSDETLMGVSLAVDHILPVAAGGLTERENLWLACRSCNEFKGAQTEVIDPESKQLALLFNPRSQDWYQHFAWSEDKAEVVGLTATGRATVIALQLNRPLLVQARRRWAMAGWHPPVTDASSNE